MDRWRVSTQAFTACLVLSSLFVAVPGSTLAAVRESIDQFDSGGSLITVECFAPTPRGKHPLVLLLHGSGGLEQATGEVFQGIARKMAARGYVVLIPHYFDRKGGPAEWVQVVDDAIAFAAGGGVEGALVDQGRIGLFGFSMGSSLAAHRASRDPNVRAIVAVSGLVPAHPNTKIPPVLILSGAQDKGVPRARLNEFEAAMKARNIPCVVHVYPHLGHNLSIPRFFDAGKRAADFYDKYVKEGRRPDSRGG
jgi:carboxymethylenebutenolidase